MMKAVTYRRLLHAAQDKGIELIQNRTYAALQAWWRTLYARLRKIRKVDIEDDDEYWEEQIALFQSKLEAAIIEAAKDVDTVNMQYYTGYKYITRPWDKILDDYYANVADKVGRGRNQIGEDTRVKVRDIVVEWYKTDKGLDALVDQLTPMFGPVRAELIAQTEMTGITAQLTSEIMLQGGETDWIWETANDKDVCEDCIEKHGKLFTLNDDMPPLHPRCRCDMGIAKYAYGEREPAFWEK